MESSPSKTSDRFILEMESIHEIRLTDPVKAMERSRLLLAEVRQQKDVQLLTNSLCCVAAGCQALGELDEAVRLLDEALTYAEESQKEELIGEVIHLQGIVLNACGQILPAREKYQQALKLFKRIGNDSWYAFTSMHLATQYHAAGDYVNAIHLYGQALEFWERAGHTRYQAAILGNMAQIYVWFSDYAQAEIYHKKALELSSGLEARAGRAFIYSALGNIALRHQDAPTALAHFHTALQLSEEAGNLEQQAVALTGLGGTYELFDNFDQALEYANTAYAMAERIGDHYLLNMSALHRAQLYIGMEKYTDAQTLLLAALDQIQEKDFRSLLFQGHELLAKVYEFLGDMPSAYEHYKQFVMVRDEVQGNMKQQEITYLQMRLEHEKAEREKEILRLTTRQLEMEVEYKVKEVETLATGLIQKREALEKMKEEIRHITQYGQAIRKSAHVLCKTGGKTNPVIASDPTFVPDVYRMAEEQAQQILRYGNGLRKSVRDLVGKMEHLLSSERDWQMFERQFHQLHQEFIRTLSERYPALTPTELKICSLLKVNRSTKDIARILCISSGTVDSHRFRIRRKMALSPAVNLTSFLTAI